jgi:hypothetical protein
VIGAFQQLEAVLISVTNPGSNKQSGTFSGAIQVFQVPHADAEGNYDTKLGRIMAKLEEIEANLGHRRMASQLERKPKSRST